MRFVWGWSDFIHDVLYFITSLKIKTNYILIKIRITRRSLFWGATRQDVLDQNSNAELYINNSMNVIRKSKASPECN